MSLQKDLKGQVISIRTGIKIFVVVVSLELWILYQLLQ